MKKIIGGLLACACVWLASPVLAATITVNDVVDVGSDYARYFLNQSNHIVGFTTPTTSVEAWDVVEGTVRFTGGHVKATDLSSFTVYGKV